LKSERKARQEDRREFMNPRSKELTKKKVKWKEKFSHSKDF